MTDLILAALLALAPHHSDRALTRDERSAMLEPVAAAIAAVSRNEHEASFLAAQGWHESAYSSAILRGECGPKQCDPGRDGKPQSVGPFQVKARWCEGHATLEGQARCALRQARGGLQRCRHTKWLGAFSAQSGGLSCNAPWAAKRVSTMRRSLERIQRARWEARP